TLLVLFATALTASAQLSFTMDGNTIENGATITSSKLDPTFAEMGFVMFKPDVFVSSEKADIVTVEVKALDGRSVSLCFGGNCISGANLSKSKDMAAGESVDIMLDAGGMFISGTQTYKCEVTAYYTSDRSSTISFTMIMTNDPTVLAVGSIEAENDGVMFDGRTMSYTFAAAAPRTVSLYTVSGKQVAQWNVDAAAGTLSLDTLQNGTYVYVVKGAGTNISGKVVLK
ncbi:MAG: T9SS type A sorting domain-containing protein, partial [Prevotella sp.]|nr:T9SS type A sorting domain-containing protein [Prevotella sp.]